MAQRTCTIDGCMKPHSARGYCPMHYRRFKKHGDALYEPEPRPTECIIPDCGKKPYGHGWCQAHYAKWKKYGDPLEQRYGLPPKQCKADGCEKDGTEGHGWCYLHYRRFWRHGDPQVTSRIVGDDDARFWAYIEKDPATGCWVWTGTLSADGYGVINVGGKRRYTHTWYYEEHVSPVPDGLEPDHLCRNRPCANPGHLELVTHRENILRGESPQAINARKTHCIRGHEFTPENTYRTPSTGGRSCRKCMAIQAANRIRRRRVA